MFFAEDPIDSIRIHCATTSGSNEETTISAPDTGKWISLSLSIPPGKSNEVVGTYVAIKGVFISWSLVGVEMIGIFIGAMIGPRTQKYIPDIWLKRIFVVLAVYVGIRYMSKGFFGQSWLPPF